MIELRNVEKSYKTTHGSVRILNGASLLVGRHERIGIVGRNGAGKSTMIRLIGGVERPDSGQILRSMSVSWPLAFGGAFQGSLTGLDNARFICRIYGKNWQDHIEYIDEFAELGKFLREPINSYSSGMRARLAFALSMTIDFDCFLIDEVVAVGDDRFREKCQIELFEKRADRAKIIVSHDANYVRGYCERLAILHEGELHSFSDMDQAFDFYHSVTHSI